MIIHDIRYSALDQHQIEGRTHRDGQNAIAYYAFAEGTIEEQIVSRTIDRLADMATMLGDDTCRSGSCRDTCRLRGKRAGYQPSCLLKASALASSMRVSAATSSTSASFSPNDGVSASRAQRRTFVLIA
jgi:hypothetical protein